MKHEEVYKLSDLFNFEEVKDLEIIDPSPKAGFSLNLSDKY